MVRSWAKRQEWFNRAAKALRANHAASVADLPPAKVRELAESACEVWKEESKTDGDGGGVDDAPARPPTTKSARPKVGGGKRPA
jgi:hypothetical protein